MKRSEILANRKIVVAFLQQPERTKAYNLLDQGNGSRCCIGHMCYVLQLPSKQENGGAIRYCGMLAFAPQELIDRIGLYAKDGRASTHSKLVDSYYTLVELNDAANWSPQEIGAYLESVIEGGSHTPWKPLEAYPE